MVYFVESEGLVKIGSALEPKKRLAILATAIPYDLKLLFVMNGGLREETQLHELFKKSHYRGEWFYLSDEILDYIREQKEGGVSEVYKNESEDMRISRCRKIREAEGLSVRDVAEKMGLSSSSVWDIEQRETGHSVSISTLGRYGRALGYKLNYYFVK